MIDNALYNLALQLVEENKSLYRIQNHYLKDARSDAERALWEEMQAAKEKNVRDLTARIKEHLA